RKVLAEVLDRIAGHIRPEAVVISLAEAVTTDFLAGWLGGRGRIVRALTGEAMLIGRGVTVLAGGPRAGPAEIKWCEGLFAACGEVLRVEEELLDAAGTLAQVAAAAFYGLVEALAAAGTGRGLEASTAGRVAAAACRGAAGLLAETNELPEVLRARLAGPAGAIRRAARSLEMSGLDEVIARALAAAEAGSEPRDGR
ncbi:MAG: hypothetical protein J7M21_06610, partial [Planctomycetes bacterium]|nr:hypothetical protein [Planctomycetota bacterium]